MHRFYFDNLYFQELLFMNIFDTSILVVVLCVNEFHRMLSMDLSAGKQTLHHGDNSWPQIDLSCDAPTQWKSMNAQSETIVKSKKALSHSSQCESFTQARSREESVRVVFNKILMEMGTRSEQWTQVIYIWRIRCYLLRFRFRFPICILSSCMSALYPVLVLGFVLFWQQILACIFFSLALHSCLRSRGADKIVRS